MATEYIRETVPLDRLQPHPLSEEIFGVLAGGEMQDLIDDIAKFGLRNTLEVDQDYRVICGSQRLRAMRELAWPTVEIKRRPDPWDEADLQEFLIKDNLHRRHLSIEQQYKAGRKLKEIYAVQAEKRMMAGTLASTGGRVRTSEQVADDLGTSHATFERMEKVFESGQQEVIEKLKRGELSIRAAAAEIDLSRKVHEAERLDPDSDRSLALRYFKWQVGARTRLQQIERMRIWFTAHPPNALAEYAPRTRVFLEEMNAMTIIENLHEAIVRIMEEGAR